MSAKNENRILEVLKKLKLSELEELFKIRSNEEMYYSSQIEIIEEEVIIDSSGNERVNKIKVYPIIHGSIKRTCYLVYAKYQYHAWVTLNGNPYNVDEISAKMDSGNGNFSKVVKNTHQLKKLDEVYEYGVACKSATMEATARKGNLSGTVKVKLK
jgi:hypothetical protein